MPPVLSFLAAPETTTLRPLETVTFVSIFAPADVSDTTWPHRETQVAHRNTDEEKRKTVTLEKNDERTKPKARDNLVVRFAERHDYCCRLTLKKWLAQRQYARFRKNDETIAQHWFDRAPKKREDQNSMSCLSRHNLSRENKARLLMSASRTDDTSSNVTSDAVVSDVPRRQNQPKGNTQGR